MSGIYSYADCEKIDKFADMVIPVVLTGKEYNKGEFNIKLIGVEEINSLLNKSDIDQTGSQATDESQVGEKTAYGTSPLKELPPCPFSPIKITACCGCPAPCWMASRCVTASPPA